jgi:hypothetical protein
MFFLAPRHRRNKSPGYPAFFAPFQTPLLSLHAMWFSFQDALAPQTNVAVILLHSLVPRHNESLIDLGLVDIFPMASSPLALRTKVNRGRGCTDLLEFTNYDLNFTGNHGRIAREIRIV